MGSILSSIGKNKTSPKSTIPDEKPAVEKTQSFTSTEAETLVSEPITMGPPTFASDLESVVKSSRSVFSSDPKPKQPLPKCFFSLKADADGKGFQFDFQWCSNDGAVIHVAIVDEEQYPTAHKWKVENHSSDESPSFVTDTIARQGEWDGLRLREMLNRMDQGFWGRA